MKPLQLSLTPRELSAINHVLTHIAYGGAPDMDDGVRLDIRSVTERVGKLYITASASPNHAQQGQKEPPNEDRNRSR